MPTYLNNLSLDPVVAHRSTLQMATRLTRRFRQDRDFLAAVLGVTATATSKGDRIILVADAGGYEPLIEGMIVQLLVNLQDLKTIPQWRKWIYWVVHTICGRFLYIK